MCTKQALVKLEAVGGFTSAGEPPSQLLCRSGCAHLGLSVVRRSWALRRMWLLRRRTKVLLVVFGWDGFRLDGTDLFCPQSGGRWCRRPDPTPVLGCRASTEWGGSARREPAMSWHMAGECPPRSAVASGPLKCGPFFSAGSCAFGLFVIRRFGESERVSGPGATPPLASPQLRIKRELSRARGWAVGGARPCRLLD